MKQKAPKKWSKSFWNFWRLMRVDYITKITVECLRNCKIEKTVGDLLLWRNSALELEIFWQSIENQLNTVFRPELMWIKLKLQVSIVKFKLDIISSCDSPELASAKRHTKFLINCHKTQSFKTYNKVFTNRFRISQKKSLKCLKCQGFGQHFCVIFIPYTKKEYSASKNTLQILLHSDPTGKTSILRKEDSSPRASKSPKINTKINFFKLN